MEIISAEQEHNINTTYASKENGFIQNGNTSENKDADANITNTMDVKQNVNEMEIADFTHKSSFFHQNTISSQHQYSLATDSFSSNRKNVEEQVGSSQQQLQSPTKVTVPSCSFNVPLKMVQFDKNHNGISSADKNHVSSDKQQPVDRKHDNFRLNQNQAEDEEKSENYKPIPVRDLIKSFEKQTCPVLSYTVRENKLPKLSMISGTTAPTIMDTDSDCHQVENLQLSEPAVDPVNHFSCPQSMEEDTIITNDDERTNECNDEYSKILMNNNLIEKGKNLKHLASTQPYMIE